jgi:energy-coupling factor transporter ATP-binding protein EcfA2
VLALFRELHSEGQTIVVVTHEPHVAAHARRRIVLRDGAVESDEATVRRGDAGGDAGERPGEGRYQEVRS